VHVKEDGIDRTRDAYRTLVGKPERKFLIGKSRFRWEDNINMDLKQTGCEAVDWTHLPHDRDHFYEYCNETSISVIGGEFNQLSNC
jgi:hypothetical protein